MDFNDTPQEAAFRAEARGWLEKNAERLKPGQRRESPSAPASRQSVPTAVRTSSISAARLISGQSG